MPIWLVIVLVVVVVLVLVLAVGGALARQPPARGAPGPLRRAPARRSTATSRRPTRRTAAGSAAPSRPPRAGLRRAQRGTRARRRSTLVQVVDRPGTDDDKAVFRSAGRRQRLALGRRDGDWVLEALRGRLRPRAGAGARRPRRSRATSSGSSEPHQPLHVPACRSCPRASTGPRSQSSSPLPVRGPDQHDREVPDLLASGAASGPRTARRASRSRPGSTTNALA